jgi:hypothetical protein
MSCQNIQRALLKFSCCELLVSKSSKLRNLIGRHGDDYSFSTSMTDFDILFWLFVINKQQIPA